MQSQILQGDALQLLKAMPDDSIDCCVTSPPYYGLRDYGAEGQLGQESNLQDFVMALCDVFDEVRRVLKPDGTCWVNVGDTYLNKMLLQIPSRFAIEMASRGWILRNTIIWHKPNAMPQPVKDRFNVDFENLFFFVKNKKYYFHQQLEPAVQAGRIRSDRFGGVKHNGSTTMHSDGAVFTGSDTRTKRAVWSINTRPYKAAHFAVYPEELVETPILAGCPPGGTVIDPFLGSGTTAVVAKRLGRGYIGLELNPEYVRIARERLRPKVLTI